MLGFSRLRFVRTMQGARDENGKLRTVRRERQKVFWAVGRGETYYFAELLGGGGGGGVAVCNVGKEGGGEWHFPVLLFPRCKS